MFCMKAKEGRKKSIRALVAVGNGKGAAGTCLLYVKESKLIIACNRASEDVCI